MPNGNGNGTQRLIGGATVAQAVVVLISSLLIPAAIAIGTFFAVRSDLKHLEGRLSKDEILIQKNIDGLESRTSALEVSSSTRLGVIETRLGNIEANVVEIKMKLNEQKD